MSVHTEADWQPSAGENIFTYGGRHWLYGFFMRDGRAVHCYWQRETDLLYRDFRTAEVID